MSGMEHAIEQAARVIGPVMSRWDMDGRRDVPGGVDVMIARALAESGYLAPAPLREEWGYLIGTTGYLSASREAAENAVTRTGRDARLRDGNPRIARILTSDWIECEANDE